MIQRQLELSLAAGNGRRHLGPRQRRLQRAHWWFDRMREAADQAVEWQPITPPRTARLRPALTGCDPE